MAVLITRSADRATAGGKAPADVRALAQQMGFRLIDIPRFRRNGPFGQLMGALHAALSIVRVALLVGPEHCVIVQYSLGRACDRLVGLLIVRRRRSVALVHDLETLRTPGLAAREMKNLARFPVVLVHNDAMAAYLRRQLPASTEFVTVTAFPYLVADPAELSPLSVRPDKLYFIGNLAKEKASFIYGLGALGVPTVTYGPNINPALLGENVEHMGVLPSECPRVAARDGFGIVWDGQSALSLEGRNGNYLRYNSPHKFSLYMALGLPVIVPEESALAPIVRETGIGFVVRDLPEAAALVTSCTPECWRQMAMAVLDFRGRITNGSGMMTAIRLALALVGNEDARRC